ncbi:hypothetical protein WN944_022339 [Citrus x changshan-huyou]|uniref:Ubiquitin-like protease family profile domain-containing protein n=1 Tax=Citrus x changshan-huyou TaxID=2935761 RepID=A0AAP0QW17_9ROSI
MGPFARDKRPLGALCFAVPRAPFYVAIARVLIPINLEDNHWVVARVDFRRKQISIYDSVKEFREDKTYGQLLKPLQVIFPQWLEDVGFYDIRPNLRSAEPENWLIAACVKYWWFGLCSKIESFAGGDWYSLFLREGDKNCRTGHNSLSPQISECSFLQYRNKHSEIWGDKLLSPVRQDVSPNVRMLVFAISKQAFCNLGRQDIVSRATFYLPKIQNFCLEVK